MTDKTLLLTVVDRERKIFEGEVLAISSLNSRGNFDILPYHENFISIITTQLTIHTITKEKKEIKLERGVLQALENHIQVYLGI